MGADYLTTPVGLVRNWNFLASPPSTYLRTQRLIHGGLGIRRSPPTRIILAVTPQVSWTLFFVYLPNGRLSDAHRFTLAHLKTLQRSLLIVVAADSPRSIPDELCVQADALIWKGLGGYDFSAYSVGLREIAARSSGADVFILNDSIYGPLNDLADLFGSDWDLAALTASAAQENHIQSYAFRLRSVTTETIEMLSSVLPREYAFDRHWSVVMLQETRLARIASQGMTVGALWYSGDPTTDDPTIRPAEYLLDHGFPFIKKSLFTRFHDRVDTQSLARRIIEAGHPPPPIEGT